MSNPVDQSTLELAQSTLSSVVTLVEQQLKLFRLEALEQMRRERSTLIGLGIAVGLGFAAVVMMLVAAATGLGVALAGRAWAAALILSAPLLVASLIVGGVAWSRRVRIFVPLTSAELEKELRWAKTSLS